MSDNITKLANTLKEIGHTFDKANKERAEEEIKRKAKRMFDRELLEEIYVMLKTRMI